MLKNLWTILTQYRQYTGRFLISQFLSLCGVAGMLAIPLLNSRLIDEGILLHNYTTVLYFAGWMLAAAVFGATCDISATALAVLLSERIAHEQRLILFRHVQTLSFANLDYYRTSDLLARLTGDITNLKTGILYIMNGLLQAPFTLLAVLALVLFTDPLPDEVMIVVVLGMLLLLAFFLRVSQSVYLRRQAQQDAVSQVMRENLVGVRVVKAFVRQDFEKQRFALAVDALRRVTLVAQRWVAMLNPTMLMIIGLGLSGMLIVGGEQVLNHQGYQVGQIVTIIQYLFITIPTVKVLSVVLPSITAAEASASRILHLLAETPAIQDQPGAANLEPAAVQGRLAFEHVSFGFPRPGGETGSLVLQDINLVIEPGQTIGILGATGAGKSALVNLIPRFYDVTQGRITLDGVDVRQISQETLRQVVAIALQEPVLLSGLVRDSILFGNPDAGDDRMQAAARTADAESFILGIPETYEGRVARRGANFSGGQRQRLAIARALACQPRVLILDDSTSAVDVATEGRIQDAIHQQMAGITQVIVAQRISSVITADQIVLIENGRLVGSGNHESLLRTHPLYQEIYTSQLGGRVTPDARPGLQGGAA